MKKPFPAPSPEISYEITGKSACLGDAWTCAAGTAQAVWYVEHWLRYGYSDITVKVYDGHSSDSDNSENAENAA